MSQESKKHKLVSAGIVLNRKNVQEANIQCRILLEDDSSIFLTFHNIKSSRKRSVLSTEPGCIISFVATILQGGDYAFKEGSVVERYEKLKGTYEDALYLSMFLDITTESCRGDAIPGLYNLLKGALHHLAKNHSEKNQSSALLFFFCTRLIKLLGLFGEVRFCSSCGTSLKQKAFHVKPEIHFQCEACSDKADESGFLLAVLLDRTSLKFDDFYKEIELLEPSILLYASQDIIACLEHYFQKQIRPFRLWIKKYGLSENALL